MKPMLEERESASVHLAQFTGWTTPDSTTYARAPLLTLSLAIAQVESLALLVLDTHVYLGRPIGLERTP